MTTPFGYSVSFRVKHPRLRPNDIAASLNKTPRFSWAAGEPRMTPKGTLLGGTRKESYCAFEIGGGEDGELARCLLNAVDGLKAHRAYLHEIRSTGGSLMFYIFWYPNGDIGEVFETDLLFTLSDLGIDLGINVYDDRRAENP